MNPMAHGMLRFSDAEALPVCALKRTAEAAVGARCVHTVAIRLGVTPKLASTLLRRAAAEGLIPAGVLPRKTNRLARVDPETLLLVIDGARSVREVAARLGLPYAWARSNLRLAVRDGIIPASAVPDGRPRKKPGISIRDLTQALDGAKSVREVADRLGLPYQNAVSNLRRAVESGLISADVVPDGRALRRLPAEFEELVLALREQGMTYKEVGDQVGLSRERVRQILKSIGRDGRLPAKPGAVKIPKRVAAVLDKAHEFARSGVTLAEISRRLRVNPTDLSSALAGRFGFRFRVGSRSKPGRDAEVAKLHAEGLTQGAIGRRLGIAQGIVSKIFKRLGLASGGAAKRRHPDAQHQK